MVEMDGETSLINYDGKKPLFDNRDIHDNALRRYSKALTIGRDPFDMDETVDWVHSLRLVAGAGDPTMKSGLGMFIFAAGKDMDSRSAFYSADGDFLIVPQHGALDIQTELGRLLVRPNEICVIPRGIRYRISLPNGPVRGYILELYQGHFQLPELGPIGSHCLANPRDFQAPVADFVEDTESEHTLLAKFDGHLFAAKQNHSPFDVVAWHGTYYPVRFWHANPF